MKTIKFLFLLLLLAGKLAAQDAILISEGNFVRGVIQGSNSVSVSIVTDENVQSVYQAKEIKSFVWNGETFESKPIVVKKKMEYRFFKVIETGKVNLYAYGDNGNAEQPAPQRTKVRPSIGIGVGSGGFGGGVGGGISIGIGGGRRNQEEQGPAPKTKIAYFLEKPGSGPMQEVNLNNTNAVKTILLQKLTNDEDLAKSIEATESFDAKNLAAYIKAYNSKL
ncbi:MAG: hypothetical protein REI78_05475 [Pedobacter sp.]|nr:hypothetical protein [Pedobacter sp.]